MLDRIKDLFRAAGSTAGKGPANEQDEQIDTSLAAAALMFEVVWADHDIAESELAVMSTLLQKLFQLSPARIEEIHKLTQANHDASVGVFPFTRAINEQLDQDEKFSILQAMWTIALADAQIDAFEEHTIRRIADLLYVPHQRFIEAKLAARSEASGGNTTTVVRGSKSKE